MTEHSPSPAEWQRKLLAYGAPLPWRSALQLAGNALALLGLWLAMWRLAEVSYAASLLLALPAAGFVLRLFSIQHDCGHGSFFRSRRANDWVGRALSVVSLVPYSYWRSAHATHHATVGDLGRRGIGDVDLSTAREYAAMSRWQRIAYRLYRHPLVLLGIGPAVQFFLIFRMPPKLPEPRRSARNSVLLMNLALAALLVGIHATLGLGNFLAVHLPTVTIAATVGVALFYVHHNFELTYWAHAPGWRHREASLTGSSYLALPGWLQWFVGSTGIHHAHHLCPTIPNYRLHECLEDHPALARLNRLAPRDVLRSVRLGLWDEERGRLVSFADARRWAARLEGAEGA